MATQGIPERGHTWKRRHPTFAVLVLLILIGLAPTSLRAGLWYVDNAATGLNQGTSWADAWSSFGSINWDLIQPGDTVYISGGVTSKTYGESWTLNKSGTATAPITFTLDSANPSHNGVVLFDYSASGQSAGTGVNAASVNYVTWNGNVAGQRHLVFQNIVSSANAAEGVAIAAPGSTGVVVDSVAFTNINNAISLSSSTKFKVQNCLFRLILGSAGIDATGSYGATWDENLVQNNDFQIGQAADGSAPDAVRASDSVTISANVFSQTSQAGPGQGGAANYCDVQGDWVKIFSNEFVGGIKACVGFDWTQNATPHDIWVFNNLFRMAALSATPPNGIEVFGDSSTPLSSLNNLKILNNTFLDNPGACLSAPPLGGPSAAGIEVKNNLFYNCGNGNTAPAVDFLTTGSAAFDANLYFHPSNLTYITTVGGTYTAAQWVALSEPKGRTTQPQFVRYSPMAASNDGRLAFRDPAAKDHGLDLSAYFSLDKLGQARPQGPAWDIGAVEATLPLLQKPANGRYFVDSSGNPLFLTGMHTWFVLQDYVNQPAFDYLGYLNTMVANNHNCLRMWQNDAINDGTASMTPLPYLRTGPGTALLGGLKFDLSQFDPAFFDRLSNRVAQAASKNIYVSMMLFEGWPILGQGSTYLPYDYYFFSNNVNSVVTSLSQQFTLSPSAMVALNDAYVRKVVDTLNGFDNVLYEIVNEPPIYTSDWQNHLVNLIKSYEATKAKQHPVGMTAFWPNSTGSQGNTVLQQSASDWIAPYGGGQGNEPGSSAYRTNPPAALSPTKVQFLDTDHLQGFGPGEKFVWTWKAFCRGYNLLYMDPYDSTTQWEVVRALGNVNSYAVRMNLGGLVPSTNLSSTTYVLANPGNEYLIFQPSTASFTVSLLANFYQYEWFNPGTSLLGSTGILQSTGGTAAFNVPSGFTNAVLYLKAQSANCPTIVLTPAGGSLPGGSVGQAYLMALAGSGGSAPYTMSVASGVLPSGLVLSPAGALTGTPTAVGTSSFSVLATDASGCSGSATFSLAVSCASISLSPAALSPASAGTAFSQTLSASGGIPPYQFSATSLPAGLALTTGGVLSGTPPTPGTFAFSVKATDANNCSGTANYSLTVNCPTITVGPATLPNANVRVAYRQTLAASGGVGSYRYTGISLPTWLTLTSAGVLSGTPSTSGTYTFSAKATDANNCSGTTSFSLIVNCPTISVSPTSLAAGNAGAGYNQTLTSSGGSAPYSFTGLSLPAWLNLSSGGILSGTPPVPGTFTFSVTALDVNGCTGSRSYTLTINCPTISVLPASLSAGTTDTLFSQAMSATGGASPYSFTGNSLPSWLTVTSAGLLSGTSSVTGTFSFSVTAKDANGCSGTRSLSLTIKKKGH